MGVGGGGGSRAVRAEETDNRPRRCVVQRSKARDQREDEIDAGDSCRLRPLDVHKLGTEARSVVFSNFCLSLL